MVKLAKAYLYLLKRGPPTPPKKCLEAVVEHFFDSWFEYEEPFTLVQE